ncbi:MAG: hypothetical protein V8T13_09020 [[Ruminococcus] lactaris]
MKKADTVTLSYETSCNTIAGINTDSNELTVDYTPGKQETAREDFNNSRNYV